jgi:acetyl esterase/lipase
MKYPLDKQFWAVSRLHLPLQRWMASPSQIMLRALPCRSDRDTEVQRMMVVGPDGNRIPTLIIRPRGTFGALPCLYDIHGGGFVFAAAPYHYALAKAYAARVRCAVVFPDYRLAPKHPYPAAAEDCFAVWRWLLQNACVLKIDPERIAIGGDSAGGDLAAAVTLMARDRGEKLPCFQMLIYPVTDRRMQTESTRRFPDTPVWGARDSVKMWEYYLPTLPAEHIEYASPLEAPSVEGLPPAYLEVAEFDSLRDEGLAYGRRLEAAGIPVEYHETRGTPHGFEFVTNAPITKAAVEKRIEVLKRVLK